MTPHRELILGPPGTGKTTTLLGEVDELLKATYDPERIAFVSFTRAAIKEARDRLDRDHGLPEARVPWVRTLHSSFARLIGFKRDDGLQERDIQEFNEAYGYDIDSPARQDLDEGYMSGGPTTTDGDRLLSAYDWGRQRCMTVDETARAWPGDMDREALREFAARYAGYKRSVGKLDFTDILERAVEQRAVLPVDAAIVDECQDLSALQIRALHPTLSAVSVLLVAGDDDQAIYAFQGGSARWVLALAARWRGHSPGGVRVLEQSYRVPRAVHAAAQAVIGRNVERVPKEYRARDYEGQVITGSETMAIEALRSEPGSTFVLARTRASTARVVRALHDAGVPYMIERGVGPNPLGRGAVRAAVATATGLGRGKTVRTDDLRDMLALIRSRGGSVLPHGLKAELKRRQSYDVSPIEALRLGLGPLVDRIRAQGPVEPLDRIEPDIRSWLTSVLVEGLLPMPRVRVSTIHGVKGREADLVVVVPDHPAVVERDLRESAGREAEARVAYVALTRARESVMVLHPRDRFHYAYV